MIHLRSVELLRPGGQAEGGTYPFSVPAVAALATTPLTFTSPVTFLAGENGAGKSAILEGLACAVGAIAVAGDDLQHDASLAPARQLAHHLRLVWRSRSRRGYFLRAEDFFGFARRVTQLRSSLEEDLAAFNAAPGPESLGRRMARGAYQREIGELRRTDAVMNEISHGESFLALFQRRFVPRGLYLLDEPETPLSPMRQFAMLSLLQEMTTTGESQFIIASHSPILMAYPGATIYHLGGGAPEPIAWANLEHVRLTRDFLNDPQLFLRHLLAE
ncbi:MAG: AAA family ATPase [Thermomicrobiales bacterium]|nr:AAA family ATPase [Thermomicrobiales bacterium]